MNHTLHTFERFVLAPMITVTVAIVGWSLVNIIELKEDVATVKTDIRHITKSVDTTTETLARLSEKISLIDSFPSHSYITSAKWISNVSTE
jgi:hypothetical protein